MKSMIPLWSFIGLAICRPCPADDAGSRLSLKLEKGKDYIFMVSSSAGLEPVAPPGPKPSEKEGIIALGTSDLQYSIEVKDATGGGASLLVSLDGPVEGPSPAKSSRQSSPATTKKTYKIEVDREGRVTSVAPAAGASEKEEKEAGLPGASPASKGGASSPESVRSTIELILGRGVHDKPLEIGKVYNRETASAGAKPAANDRGAPRDIDPAAPGAAPSRDEIASLLSRTGFRFEGKKKDREREIARFAVLAAASNSSPSSAKSAEGEGIEGKPSDAVREDRGDGLAKGIASESERVGEASFRWEDGIADTISVLAFRSAGGAKKDGFGGTSAGNKPEGVRLTILRIDREAKTKTTEK